MPLTNSSARYGSVARTFHWLTALLILAQIPLGFYADYLPYDTSDALAFKATMFSLHKTLGVAIFFVAVARILWAVAQPKPAPLHPDRRAETWAAETVHWLLYGSLVLVPLSGWVHHAATSGFAPILWPFGQSLPLVPQSETLAAITAGLHGLAAWVLVAAIGLHVAGALKHAIIDRDATLRRMTSGAAAGPAGDTRHAVAGPLATALAAWLAVLGAGYAAGFYGTEHTAGPAQALAEVQSEWQVEEGSVTITVNQFGSDVSGSFADWTADISFDPDSTEERMGGVLATISVGSLTLGSVTQQALGADYLDASGYPTATFDADIFRADDGFEARGDLTIKDVAAPAVLAFSLEIIDDVAEMQGNLTLDRRDYGVGDSLPDEKSLKFPVAVSVALTARRGGQ
ncbi:cytochrome b/b6 domain-containing protein [Sulfitobacter sp. D35]|uniref:cytochrome b/b6 domain-containing protein n=1 Tax=Sulfitobacter sp. D35 TaxID=3083252 RepID=UPI00296F27D8|nr:cytochrome b/b6 domain-containing protein [Sulfitobacter sp. D35]MDW4496830.1 cytochrome b/b6 domain-containing protein [Sulfitobacter sp. D35]